MNRQNVEKKEWKYLFNHSQIFTFVLNSNNQTNRAEAEKAAPVILIRKRIPKIPAGLENVTAQCSKSLVINILYWKCSPDSGGIFPAVNFFCFKLPGMGSAEKQQRYPGR
jgi:hypothetical protein